MRADLVRGALASIVLVLVLGSCGVEGESSSSAATPTTEDEAPPTTEEVVTEEPDDADDGGDSGDDTTSTTSSSTTTGPGGGGTPSPGGLGNQDEMIRDALIQGFQQAGLTAEQATCLADGYIDMGLTDPAASADIDIMAMMDVFTQCGISMEDLANLGAGMGAG
jgi:hypothetical protein